MYSQTSYSQTALGRKAFGNTSFGSEAFRDEGNEPAAVGMACPVLDWEELRAAGELAHARFLPALWKLVRAHPGAVVFTDMKPRIPSVSSVICDNFSGGHEGMRHLLDLGHRRIGIIAGEQTAPARAARTGPVGLERVLGMVQASRSLAPDAELIFSRPFPAATVELGASETELLLADHPEITAIFATTDILAIGAMQAAHRLGIKVPEELSILGYDGIMESSITFPTLSTIRQPIHEMGELAARTLLTQIRQPNAPAQQVVLENNLLVRDSTAAPKNGLEL